MTSMRAVFSNVLPFDALWRSVRALRAEAATTRDAESDGAGAPGAAGVEIVLAPSGLGPRDREVAASFAEHGVRVLEHVEGVDDRGESARRRAVESGDADVTWFLEPGAEIAMGSLAALDETLRSEPWIGLVDASVRLDREDTLRLDVRPPGEAKTSDAVGRLHRFEAPGPVEIRAAAGLAIAMTRAALEAAGPPPGPAGGPEGPGGPDGRLTAFLERLRERGLLAVRSPEIAVVANPALGDPAPPPEAIAAPGEVPGPAETATEGSLPSPGSHPSPAAAVKAGSGVCLAPPGDVPRAFVELASSEAFRPSALGPCPKSGVDLGAKAYRRAAPGRYFLRFLDPVDGRELARHAVDVPREHVPPSEIEIGPYRPGDEYAILALWSKVFGKERELAMWRWLFTENPAGMHVMLGRAKDGSRVVSQFAGMQLRIQIRGESHLFAQMVDSMSDPDCRQTLSRSGVFTDTVLEYVRTWGRPGEETFGFGLPNRLAYRIGKRTQGYTDIFPLEWRVRDVADLEPREAPPAGFEIVASDTIHEGVEELWRRVAPRIPMCTIRDRRYLEWRYLRHPERSYRFFHVVDSADGRVIGFAVGAPGFIERPWYAIGDWLLEPGATDAGRWLVGACEDAARDSGSERILGSILPAESEADRILESLGYPRETSQWKWVGRIYDESALDWDFVRSSFYLTLGDSDLF